MPFCSKSCTLRQDSWRGSRIGASPVSPLLLQRKIGQKHAKTGMGLWPINVHSLAFQRDAFLGRCRHSLHFCTPKYTRAIQALCEWSWTLALCSDLVAHSRIDCRKSSNPQGIKWKGISRQAGKKEPHPVLPWLSWTWLSKWEAKKGAEGL